MKKLNSSFFILLLINCFSLVCAQNTVIKNWNFDQTSKSNIVLNEGNGVLKLGLVTIQFSEQKDHKALLDKIRTVSNINPEPLWVNNVIFNGELEGLYNNGKLMFQVLYFKGLRVGNMLYVNPKGDSSWFYFPYPKEYYAEIGREMIKSPQPSSYQSLDPKDVKSVGEGQYIFEIKDNDEGAVKKPVIYLYPTEKTEISIKLDFNQKQLTHTYPKYNPEKGWNVIAEPNGNLKNVENGKDYYALFWEGESQKPTEIKQGFVVKGENTAEFLEEKLAILGLNWRESNEFIMYWLPEMENNKYNLIHFSTEEYTNNFPVVITPRPDNFVRVFMVFEPLETAIEIPAQELTPAKRGGFTAVEWGGTKQEKPKF